MKVSILSTIAAFLLPMAAMAAPSEGARGLIKRDYRTRYTASGRRGRIFPYDSRDSYVLTNDTILQVVHIDLPPDYIDGPPRYGFAFPLSSGSLAMYFVMDSYFEEHPEHAEYSQDFVVTTIDPATCEVTLSFGGRQQFLHFPAKGQGSPLITLRTDDVPRENAHAVQTITAVPVNSRPE
ncbi:hypothetical protein SLS64_005672 [Diaporthe eres]|uniref:Uncharacterized protein n=1 Tax=Diaporthe eres TaxID=83184 RepID=A0ABR1NTK4_DIAER